MVFCFLTLEPATLDAILTGMTPPKPKLRRFQFSLRTLLIFVTLCAIPCSWLAVKIKRFKQRQKAAAAIEKLGGSVHWSERSEFRVVVE